MTSKKSNITMSGITNISEKAHVDPEHFKVNIKAIYFVKVLFSRHWAVRMPH